MAIESNGTGGGDWSVGATWALGAVPVNNDAVHINVGDLVYFDDDQSGFANGLGTLDIDGSFYTDSGLDRYLKVNADITGVGVWSIDDGAGGDWPSDKKMTIDLGGGSNSIDGSSGLELNFRCAEPDNQFVRLSAPASATDVILPVDRDVRLDKWKVGDTVHVANINNGPQIEEHELSGIGANTITIVAPGLTADKLEGTYIFLQNRNIRIINTTSFAIKTVSDSIIRAEISDATNGVNVLIGCTVGGVIAPSGSYAVRASNENLLSGFMISPFCLQESDNNIITGIIAGSNFGVNGSYGNFISGLIVGCNQAFSTTTAQNICTGTVIGCTYANRSKGHMMFKDATLDNNQYSMHRAGSFSVYNTLFNDDIEFHEYTDQARAPWLYCFSDDHDQVPGAFKAWTRGGIVTNDTSIKPPGEIQSYKHACEDADNPVFKQDKILVQPGKNFTYTIDVVKDSLMVWLPRAQLLLPEEDPLVDAGNSPLDEAIMDVADSIDTWEKLSLTYTNTTDYPVEVLVRTLAMNGTGNAWFLVRGGPLGGVSRARLVNG